MSLYFLQIKQFAMMVFLLFDFNLNRQNDIMIQFDTKQYNMIQYILIWFILFVPTSWAFNATCIFRS